VDHAEIALPRKSWTDTQAPCYVISMSQQANMRAVLEWHQLVGVDETIAPSPVDRFNLVEKQSVAAPEPLPATAVAVTPPSSPPSPPALPKALPPSSDQAVKTAVDLAAGADNIDALRAALEGFDECALKKTATNLVFVDGNPDARVLFIGEGPGAEEDRQGLPFVGPSGKLLDKMLASIGLERNEVLISNTVFWRPPGNRTPTPQEIATCMPFVERLIELVDPDVLVPLGGPAAKSLLGETQGIGRLRGRWFSFETSRMSHPVPATPMFHPAYLLRTPIQKRAAWNDLRLIRKKLAESG
jgi:uracil-DNA glycosylase